MFEWSDEERRRSAQHHPFTRPAPGWEERFDQDPKHAVGRAYDLIGYSDASPEHLRELGIRVVADGRGTLARTPTERSYWAAPAAGGRP